MASDVTKSRNEMEKRNRNLAAFAIVAAFLTAPFISSAVADKLVDKMYTISDTLKNDLSGVLETVGINYSEPVINAKYVSNTLFNMKGMGILYNATYQIIDIIVKKDAYPEGIVTMPDGHHVELAPLQDPWKTLLGHYAGVVTVLVLAVLFILFYPLVGLCWCCCFCAQSRSRQPFDRKNDGCIKAVLALVLICVITLFMFGVVSSFVTDEHISTSSEELPTTQRMVVADLRAYLNSTNAHQRHILVTNYKELEEKLLAMIDSSGLKVSIQLGEFSRAVSVTTLNKMVQDLDKVRANLATVKNVTLQLRANAEQLDQDLRKVKGNLLNTLKTCNEVECRRIEEKYRIGQLSADIDYNQLPDVTTLLNNVNDLITGNIKKDVEDGHRVFNDLKNTIERQVNQHIPKMKTYITDTGKKLTNISDKISASIESADRTLQVDGMRIIRDTEDNIEKYEPYRRYVGIGLCTFILTVLFTLVMGLLCGVCGKRPEGYGNNDCCNKGAGSKCLITGIVLTFLLGWVVAVAMLGYFLVGVSAQRFVCDPLTDPVGNRLFNDLESIVQLGHMQLLGMPKNPGLSLTSILVDCHRNQSIYQVLQLNETLGLEQEAQDASRKVEERLTQLAREVSFKQPRLVILKPEARKKLEKLADTGLSDFPFDRFTDILVNNITSIDLVSLASQLTSTADSIQGRPQFRTVARQLRDAADVLRRCQTDTVDHMLRESAKLNSTAIQLRNRLKFNHSSFKNAVEYLLDETAGAEQYLLTQGPDVIRNLTEEFAEAIAQLVRAHLERVVGAARDDVGRCGPVSNAYNATINATCRKILMPINGLWMSLAWCLLLFFPIVCISQKLAKLYTNTDPYPGPLVEAEYMYDAYADRDNIPLANAYLKEKRGRRERGGERSGSEAVGGIGEARRGEEREGIADESASTEPNDTRRYNDMAPKHWEEGPPRYHGPTEYERPPPYYYPGPNNRE